MKSAEGKWGDLGQRMVSGGAAAALGLAVMWYGGFPFHILVSLICGLIVWELVRMLGAGERSKVFGIGVGFLLLAALELPAGFALPLLFLPSIIGVALLERHKYSHAIFCAAVLFAGYGLVALRDDFGFGWMAWLALVVIVTDILGYFAGRFIGGPKFWPRVSPKKTWSGTVAGWIGAALVGAIFVWLGQSGYELIGISIAVSIAGQFGDVAESALKRRMGVKDSSSILPGHGGMFDRFDAMLGASLFLLVAAQIVDFPPAPVPL